MIPVSYLPSVNAALNLLSALLLLGGYLFIRRGSVWGHRLFMLLAFSSSTLFLISYLIYHFQVGSVEFRGKGWVRPAYPVPQNAPHASAGMNPVPTVPDREHIVFP